MNFLRPLTITLSLTLFCLTINAQQKDSTLVGTAEGSVKDSVHNFVLRAATIAVYRRADSILIGYQLSNNLGEFRFKELPVGTSLQAVFSFTGYKQVAKNFIIDPQQKIYNLKITSLERSESTLETVVVTAVPPVRMNKDTLEFNADAFKLDKNAVVEDLMRKLPGITIWGDGKITFNGRPVNEVLVDGKPFFGGESKLATQNLPKDAVDKIQVYKQSDNHENQLDSTIQVNIKLKENKKVGGFGKLGAGYGTDDRYEGDGSMNLYNALTQFGVIATTNNINKVSSGTSMLMENSTYKGEGASTQYQPSFETQGQNRFTSAGLTYRHDFIPDANHYRRNNVSGNYFFSNNKANIFSGSETDTYTGIDTLRRRSYNENLANNTNHKFDAQYEYRNKRRFFFVAPSFNATQSRNRSASSDSSFNITNGVADLQSSNYQQRNENTDANNVTVNGKYVNDASSEPFKRFTGEYDADFSFKAGSRNDGSLVNTHFVSFVNPAQNQNTNRKYDKNSDDVNAAVNFSVKDLQTLFSRYKTPLGIHMEFQNKLAGSSHKQKDMVSDYDNGSEKYSINAGLTNKLKYATIDDIAGLSFRKNINKQLPNRYFKTLSIVVQPQVQFSNQTNTSELHLFQNFNRNYQRFVPGASVVYMNSQMGDYQQFYQLVYSSSMEYPRVDQLFPLTDSSNLYSMVVGNPNLQPADKKQLRFGFQHTTQKPGHDWTIASNTEVGILNNAVADSTVYNNDGRTTYYFTNAGRQKILTSFLSVRKTFKSKKGQLAISDNMTYYFSQSPNYVNNVLNRSTSNNTGNSLSCYYVYGNILEINLSQSLSWNNSVQTGTTTNRFGSSNQKTSLSVSVDVIKSIVVNSNVAYNRYKSSGSDATTKFTLWNASASYRFLKDENAELKFSALDLLHQNKAIYIYNGNNTLTHSAVNVLQQYFMITVSYFPRKFGRKAKEEND